MTAQSTRIEVKKISDGCINCERCIRECAFLEKYGKPKRIADSLDLTDVGNLSAAFECSLCELCTAVCPVDVNPADMFLAMRREVVRRTGDSPPGRRPILAYERRGTSRRYSWYGLPEGCDAVFFPGCTLAGTRPGRTTDVYELLRKRIPSLGVVLDCCTLPSHDLGRSDYFHAMFREMEAFLLEHGVRRILLACPSCHKVFRKYGTRFSVLSVYELMATMDPPSGGLPGRSVVVHDACAIRFEGAVQSSVRELIAGMGLRVEETPHGLEKTLCCGEGGSAGLSAPGLASRWREIRESEVDGRRLIVYCAGCESCLRRVAPTSHVLDLVFEPGATLAGRVKVSRTPFTYLNRLLLKRRLKKTVNASVEREREHRPGQMAPKRRFAPVFTPVMGPAVWLASMLLGGVSALAFTGVVRLGSVVLFLIAAALFIHRLFK